MTDEFLQKGILVVLSTVLIAATSGIIFGLGSTTALTTVAVVTTGVLVILLVQSRLEHFKVGPEGVSGQLAKHEEEIKNTQRTVATQGQVVSEQGKVLKEQQEIVNNLVKYLMSASVLHHLCGIALLHTYNYHHKSADQREMYFLRDSGFIRPKSSDFIDFDAALDGQNLVNYVEPTEIGWSSIRLRKDNIPLNMLEGKANLRVDPSNL